VCSELLRLDVSGGPEYQGITRSRGEFVCLFPICPKAYVNRVVKRGLERHKVQPGSVSFSRDLAGHSSPMYIIMLSSSRRSVSIARTKVSSPTLSQSGRPAMLMLQTSCRKSAGPLCASSTGGPQALNSADSRRHHHKLFYRSTFPRLVSFWSASSDFLVF
jgi:hypothetical protein